MIVNMEEESIYNRIISQIVSLRDALDDAQNLGVLDESRVIEIQKKWLEIGPKLCSLLERSIENSRVEDFSESIEEHKEASNGTDDDSLKNLNDISCSLITDDSEIPNDLNQKQNADIVECEEEEGGENANVAEPAKGNPDQIPSKSAGYKFVGHSSQSEVHYSEQEDEKIVSQPFVLRRLLSIIDYYAVLKTCFHNRADSVAELENAIPLLETVQEAKRHIIQIYNFDEEDEATQLLFKAIEKYYNKR